MKIKNCLPYLFMLSLLLFTGCNNDSVNSNEEPSSVISNTYLTDSRSFELPLDIDEKLVVAMEDEGTVAIMDDEDTGSDILEKTVSLIKPEYILIAPWVKAEITLMVS